MHKGRQIASAFQDAPMKDVLEEMSKKKLGMACVIDREENLVGIITDGDLRRLLQKYGKNLLQKTALDCMTPDPLTIDEDDLATKGLNLMEENKITSLIIKNKKGEIKGIIHLHDLWRTEMF